MGAVRFLYRQQTGDCMNFQEEYERQKAPLCKGSWLRSRLRGCKLLFFGYLWTAQANELAYFR